MAAWAGPPRIALYSHDTFGLGHLTRSTRIAAAVSRALPGASVLILTGSPIAHRFAFPHGVDYVKLPSVIKRGPERYESLELAVSPRRVRKMRAQLISETLDTFQPNLMLVDNVPLGMKGELLPALERLRKQDRDAQIHLNLRDVLDDPDVIRESWEELGVHDVLDRIYDAIHVFGTPSVFDSIAAYRLPPEKTKMLGYIRASIGIHRGPASISGRGIPRKRVLATIGGGGDGEHVLATAVEMQRGLGASSPYTLTLVPGPFMSAGARTRLEAACRDLPHVALHDFIDDIPAQMHRSDLVLSMGGYNTMCEVLTVSRRSVVVPRVQPRREQEIRARALERHDLTRVIDPGELTPARLHDVLEEAYLAKIDPSRTRPSLDGLPCFTERLSSLLGHRVMTTRPSAHLASPTSPGSSAGEDQGSRSHSHSSPARRRARP
jgi:predicted glycosyltransferase